ncbi:hypothetical protein BZL39_A02670 [Zygosaccharomyces parabailii]|nr:hypothetical protein BZL39_A02670 [Zygosaccharomyces parabailii]
MFGEVHQDLEKHEQSFEEEEQVQLLEDKTAGELLYILSHLFWNFLWLLFVPYVVVLTCVCFWASYLVAQVVWSYPKETSEPPFPFTWVIVHYCLGIISYIISSYGRVHMKPEALGNFLEAVASFDLAGDPIVWRRIAYSTNQHFRQIGYRYPLFYSGDQCLRYLIKEILEPVEAGSYDIELRDGCVHPINFCSDASNKALVQRAVANYNKSIEGYGDLSKVREQAESRSDQFDKIVGVILLPIFAWFLIQSVAIIVLWMCTMLILIPSAIIRGCLLGG